MGRVAGSLGGLAENETIRKAWSLIPLACSSCGEEWVWEEEEI